MAEAGPVLLTAWFDRPWAMGHYLAHALRRLGLEVETLDYRAEPDPGTALVAAARRVRPAVSVLFKGEGVPPAAVLELRRLGVPSVLWHHDTNWERPAWLMDLVRAHDHYFTHALGMVDRMREAGIEHVSWLSEGFEPDFYRGEAMDPAERSRLEADVLFIGNIHEHPLYWPRRAMLERCLREGLRTRWWGPRVPRRLRFLPLLLGRVGRAWGGGMVYNEGWARVVAASRVFIARDVQPEVRCSISNRAYWAMGCGAFYLCYHAEGIEEVFEVGRELVTFHDLDEMVSRIRYYLGHEEERRAIAQAGQRRVLEHYTYADRFREMFRVLEGRGLWRGVPREA
ncbi:MAG: glycosyltransferase [Planctomycetes bacterium]|nr:glycosyltransferase [Planctomycetota bacterium]